MRTVSICLRGWNLSAPEMGRGNENVVILAAIAVNEDGYREVLGVAEDMKEDKAG